MTHYYKITAFIAAVAFTVAACTEDTGEMGVYDNADAISTSTATFSCSTSSVALGAVRSSSDKCYIGQITDPETGAILKADFVAQFNTYEGALLPPSDRIVCDEDGNYQCDSVNIRLFFQEYYGDGLTPFKLNVYELSMQEDRMLREDSIYFTDVELSSYIATPEELATRKGLPCDVSWPLTKVFTPIDHTENDSTINSSTHYSNVNIVLPPEYGRRILNLYRSNPEYFTTSYRFIRNVCPGFYFNVTDGNGAMMYVDVSSLDIYYQYHNTDTTTQQGVCRFSATAEVIQATRFEGGGNDELLADESCTYLKSPAGIGTAMRLPVDEIFKGHENDSLALASINLTCYNATGSTQYALSPCSTVAMVERSEMSRFFEKGYVRNARAYAVAALSSSTNLYSFSNIGRLVSYLYEKKRTGAETLCNGDTAAYARLHPEWNEVVLMPVTVTTNSSSQVVSITNDMSITSTRLVGGRNNPISMQVVYCRYNK